MNSIISLKNVSKRFGNKQALDHVNLEIPSGIVFALLGENGAGKTTMIRILTGTLKPDSGHAEVLGMHCLKESEDIRKKTGYVSDAPAMYDWMTAEEIGWFTSAFYDDLFPGRYVEALGAFDISPGVKIKHMSKGQRAKVALALATSHDPSLLILDEPTSGLDPMVRRQFLESMVDRAALGHTVLLSSHQISEVERVADWIGILHEGELKLVKPLQALRDSTQVITATLDHSDATVVLPRGDVLTESKNGRQLRWIVTDLADDWRQDYDENAGVVRVDQATPTLEEIFVAVCDPHASRPKSQPPEAKPSGEVAYS
ncbi:ABC transporter ATP-binding protein [Roseiconus lacunae]|uniref:ABC transporter ATP-binding protein n=1 Tax=Roseiconus lacunae TaxID=2605694 RepID=A0ABT7PGB8_9BACT|nr:ABC transporter ATP-binding protein [Roseiconus lacunae]MCD0460419.1 ABC transporter ATP-binding protein [Roseiconus lacunae]MDM4015534.1 ABC transporter ATP-binding protein [Roseiconus lacunae]WRQ52789.1 ABC transporter ATP-binding protein [Stieleria sp. HD01]